MPRVKPRNIIPTNDHEITNYYEHPDIKEFMPNYSNPHYKLNQMKTPFYCVISGVGGGGKTNCLVNLMQRFDQTFSSMYVLNQEIEPLYEMLQKKIKGITITTKVSELPTFEELGKDKSKQKLFIFDDMLFSKNCEDYIRTMYKRGRKIGCSCIFISQSYFAIDDFLRKNLHYLILLGVNSKREIDTILSNYKFEDVDSKQLFNIFKKATEKPLDFLKINVRERDVNRKFSRNFTDYFKIKDSGDSDSNEED